MPKRDNEIVASIIHIFGVLLAIAALVLMIVYAARRGEANHIVGASIFGTTLVLLYGISTCYHFTCKRGRFKALLKRFDDAATFLLLAGTYTPISLALPNRGWGWSIFGVTWGFALIGMALKLSGRKFNPKISWAVYGGIAIIVLLAAAPISSSLPIQAFIWIMLGGLFYRFGIVVFFLEKRFKCWKHFGWHELLHILIILGSFSHFWLMVNYVFYI
jgi:hemolysin III